MQQSEERMKKLVSIRGKKTVDEFHRQLGLTMWEYCGMSRSEQGLKKAKKIIVSEHKNKIKPVTRFLLTACV
jgi:succinate dehydrogenase / fumarate reductase flavoprotein subunit